ncbi:MAG: DUF1682 domain-containing protein [Actinomycetia bacterium]|nr:DUF1682 domain-containing protein [Actinomycetes bacterium]
MSPTDNSSQEPGGDATTEAEELLSQLLEMGAKLPEPTDMIDLVAARQLRAVGGIEASVAWRAERDAAVTSVVRPDDDARVELRHHRARTARRRVTETDLVATMLEQPNHKDPEKVRDEAVKQHEAREKAAEEREAKRHAAREEAAKDKAEEKQRNSERKRDRRD